MTLEQAEATGKPYKLPYWTDWCRTVKVVRGFAIDEHIVRVSDGRDYPFTHEEEDSQDFIVQETWMSSNATYKK